MAKYSALILFFTLAIFWSSAEGLYNRYQNDVIEALSNFAIEAMRDVPEPHKSRITNKLREAKNRHWDNAEEYVTYAYQTVGDFMPEAEAQYNRYQNDLIEALTNYVIEEMPEPNKTRIMNKLNEAKNRQWDNFEEYSDYFAQVAGDYLSEVRHADMRSRRNIYESGAANKLREVSRILSVVD